jgi:primary-amine oxidase
LVERTEKLDPEFHPNVDFDEVAKIEEMVMKDASVLQEIEKLKLPGNLCVIPEPWTWGSDGVEDKQRRHLVYMNVGEVDQPDSNYYARPLSFAPIVDPIAMKVIRIDMIPTGDDWTLRETQPYRPVASNDYISEAIKLREGLKNLHVTQPDGPSFEITEEKVITWQKWKMRVGFNYREGTILRDVSYDGRPLFYRISLSEMTVPYADPRTPYNRKQAFDLGDVGAGLVANNLKLGCDCLGSIAYLNGLIADSDGRPLVKENAVCIHEQGMQSQTSLGFLEALIQFHELDNGIGWKHTNYRTNR